MNSTTGICGQYLPLSVSTQRIMHVQIRAFFASSARTAWNRVGMVVLCANQRQISRDILLMALTASSGASKPVASSTRGLNRVDSQILSSLAVQLFLPSLGKRAEVLSHIPFHAARLQSSLDESFPLYVA